MTPVTSFTVIRGAGAVIPIIVHPCRTARRGYSGLHDRINLGSACQAGCSSHFLAQQFTRMCRLRPVGKDCAPSFGSVSEGAGVSLELVTMTVIARVLYIFRNLPDVVYFDHSCRHCDRSRLVIMGRGQGAEPAGIVKKRRRWYIYAGTGASVDRS